MITYLSCPCAHNYELKIQTKWSKFFALSRLSSYTKTFVNFSFLCCCSAKLVDSALETGKIFDGEGFNYVKDSFATGTLHLIGLLSDGGVHSRIDQLQVSQFSKFSDNHKFQVQLQLFIKCSFSYMLHFS